MSRISYCLFGIYLLGLCISACSPPISLSPTRLPPLVTPILTHQVIATENIPNLAEIQTLTADQTGPVAQLMFTPDVQTLLAVYAHEGKLRQWDLATEGLSQTLDVYPVGLGGAAFNADSTMLATSSGAEWENHKLDDDYLGWQVWNIQTGGIIAQGGKYYNSVVTRNLVAGILLNKTGSWALMISASPDKDLINLKNFSIEGVTIHQTGAGYVDFSRKAEQDDFDVIAFDTPSEFFAAADEAGKVAIYAFHPPQYPDQAEAVIEKPGKRLGPRPLALAFDPQRHWLAGIRGTELRVWDLQAPGYKRQIDIVVGKATGITASLAFNPNGELLAVGTANGWQIWSVVNKKLLAEGKNVQVYAVTFSPDGRLFAWGDSAGIVHVWGIPNTPIMKSGTLAP